MNYEALKAKHRELHTGYHEAKRAGERSKMRDFDRARGDLEQSASRDYQISERILIKVYVRAWHISIGAKRLQPTEMNLVQLPHYELECFNADELHITAWLREMVQQYEDGEIEELPPSGWWYVGQGAKHPPLDGRAQEPPK